MPNRPPAPLSRRRFLQDTGMGFTGLALSSLLAQEASASHFEPQAKSVIWIFFIGGMSHLESFDPKPALNQYGGMSVEDTPLKGILDPERTNKNLFSKDKQSREVYKTLLKLQTGFKRYGQSGMEISDWFPHIGSCADEYSLVRSMWTIDNNHGAQLTFHTGRKITEGAFPTVGSWASYGLSSANANLPEYVVLGEPSADCCGRSYTHGAAYLGPEHDGIRLKVDPVNPLSYIASADPSLSDDELREHFSLLGRLNRLAGIEYPDDPELRARIKAYELAYQMQTAVPELMNFEGESKHTRELYGLDTDETRDFGQKCLAARRLVERGVRFIQLFHGYTGNAGAWDSHRDLIKNHSARSREVDQPIAALIKDLKQRGMLEDTMVVAGSEFGRTPGAEFRKDNKTVQGTGRDHHPHAFTVLTAGGGLKAGHIHGASDEIGFHAVEDRHYVTDLHATVLHQMGLDPHRLEIPGRKRTERDFGEVIHDLIA